MVPYITSVNTAIGGQIWVEVSCFTGMRFWSVYIPPIDSPYIDVERTSYGLIMLLWWVILTHVWVTHQVEM